MMTTPTPFGTAVDFCDELVRGIDGYSFGYIGNVRGATDDRLWGFFRKNAVDPRDRMVRAGATGDIEALRAAYRIVRDEIVTR